jgi:hypothetical protein
MNGAKLADVYMSHFGIGRERQPAGQAKTIESGEDSLLLLLRSQRLVACRRKPKSGSKPPGEMCLICKTSL